MQSYITIVCYEHRDNLDAYKAASSQKFRRTQRPDVEADAHGVCSQWPGRSCLLNDLSVNQAKSLVEEVAEVGAWDAWHRDENLMIKNVFDWLWESTMMVDNVFEIEIGGLIDQKFNIYLFHQDIKNDQNNKD